MAALTESALSKKSNNNTCSISSERCSAQNNNNNNGTILAPSNRKVSSSSPDLIDSRHDSQKNNARNGLLGKSENTASLPQDDCSKVKDKLEKFKCPICMEIFVNTSLISCGHRFCLYCIKQWFHHSYPRRFCPVCRKNCIYYQDDAETDLKISSLYQCLPSSDQEERSMVVLDRQYVSTLALNTRLPHQHFDFEGMVEDLTHARADQYSANSVDNNPFELEPVNPAMAENYYPSFQPYLSYETPFTELDFQTRPSVSSNIHQEIQQTVPHSASESQYTSNSTRPGTYVTSSLMSSIPSDNAGTNQPGDGSCNRGFQRFVQPSSQALRVGSYNVFPNNEVYTPDTLEIGQMVNAPPCVQSYPCPGNDVGLGHHESAMRNIPFSGSLQSPPYLPGCPDYLTAPPNPASVWNHQMFSDPAHNAYNPGGSGNNSGGPYDSSVGNPSNPDMFKNPGTHFPHARNNGPSILSQREMYRNLEGSGLGWSSELINENERSQSMGADWQVQLVSRTVDSSWCLPSLPDSSDFVHPSNTGGAMRHKFTKKCNNNSTSTNVTTTHEDYQQDVLIQEEFQRLDEMLLRDDDEIISVSDADQVSVESVVSSEQQYDSPWEHGGSSNNQPRSREVNKGKNNNGSLGPAPSSNNSQQPQSYAPPGPSNINNPGSSCHNPNGAGPNLNLRGTTALVSDNKYDQAKSRLQAERNKQMQHSSCHNFVGDLGKPAPLLQQSAMDDNGKGFIPKMMPTRVSSDLQRNFQPSQLDPRYMEQNNKRNLVQQGRTAEEVRGTEQRPPVQISKPSLESTGLAMTSGDFRQGLLPPAGHHRSTSRLPKLRTDHGYEQKMKYPPGPGACATVPNPAAPPVASSSSCLKRKPQSRSLAPVVPGPILPNNMMGVSHGDGIWGTIPEMSAHMYLPYGVLLFKMEYQPNGNTAQHISSTLNKQQPQPPPPPPPPPPQQQHQQQHPQQSSGPNLAKFTHPIIHMLPLSPDGSTRLNITFDVVYQN